MRPPDEERRPGGDRAAFKISRGGGIDTQPTPRVSQLAVEVRCGDCHAEAGAALADAHWIIDAGGSPTSDAVMYDHALASIWFDVAKLHTEGEP
jgi:hypothetical protein